MDPDLCLEHEYMVTVEDRVSFTSLGKLNKSDRIYIMLSFYLFNAYCGMVPWSLSNKL